MYQRPIIYYSGIDREEHLKLLAQERVAGMVHAAHVLQPGLLQAIQQHPEVPLVLDSGLEDKPSFDRYVALLALLNDQYPGRFRWYVSYDCPGDQARSDAYYEELRARFPHLHQQILWVFQPTWGSQRERMRCLERLEAACEECMTIALGGLVPLVRRSVRDTLAFLQQIGEVMNAYYPTEAHILGITSPDLLAWLITQPWVASLDSSRWIRAAKAHEVLLLTGEQRKASALHLPLSQEECAVLNIRALQAWIDGSVVQRPGEWMSRDVAESESMIPPHRSRKSVLSTLLRHRGRRVLCAPVDMGTPSLDWYLPLFSISEREHGLLAFASGESFSEDVEWSVIWDVDRDDPLLPRSRLFLVDGRLKTGLFSHDDVFLPCLCHYPLGTALAVAKSFVPFSSSVEIKQIE